MNSTIARRLTLLVAALGALCALLLAGQAAPAKATTAACGNTPRCFGVLSGQARPLEIATSVPVSQVQAGTTLIGMTPAFSARGDWHVGRYGVDRLLRWAPNGVSSSLCITASSDVVNSRPTLQQCEIGTAGSSHQLWRPVNVIGNGFRVYQNVADGLVLALKSDASGTPLRLRPMLNGTGGNKNFTLNKPF
ncbi:MAG TPA: RICIN domain-containing protein [Streptosporangiaceae bacterium]|nr:RICIN domain-containing protein [Streptosporangiaceae bacterium]